MAKTNEQRFKEITDEMVCLYARKNADYNNSFETTLDKWGTNIGLARIDDKLNRAGKLLNNTAQVREESIIDTLTDLACYSIMLRIYLEKQFAKQQNGINQPISREN